MTVQLVALVVTSAAKGTCLICL